MISKDVLEALLAGKPVEMYIPERSSWLGSNPPGWRLVDSTGVITVDSLRNWEWRVPKEQRDWKGALEWLKEGKKVKRAGWQADCWLLMDGSAGVQWQDPTCKRPDIYVGYYRFNGADFEATDWEIV